MNKARISAAVLGVAVLAFGIFGMINPLETAQAQGGCDLSSMNGTFVFAYQGTFTEGDNSAPFSYAGRETYDGAGNVSGITTGIDETGALGQDVAYTGTYTVDSDCSGSVLTTDENGVPANFDIFINESNGNFVYNSIDLGYVFAGTAERVGD